MSVQRLVWRGHDVCQFVDPSTLRVCREAEASHHLQVPDDVARLPVGLTAPHEFDPGALVCTDCGDLIELGDTYKVQPWISPASPRHLFCQDWDEEEE